MLTYKALDLTSISNIEKPSPFEMTLPYHDYQFSRRLYKLNHDWGIPTEKEIIFIDSYLKEKPSKVLDIACGGGRHALGLAQMDHLVTGIDIGGYPIKMAIRLARMKSLIAEFIRGDIKVLNFDSIFDLAFFICGQMAHFSPEENKIIFQKAAKALKSNGILIIHLNKFGEDDCVNHNRWYQELKPLYWKNPSLVHREQYFFENDRVKLIRDFAIDSVTQENALYGISEKEYTCEEVMELAEINGLQLIEKYGCYDKSSLSSESRNRIFVFRKGQ
jgi:SAM-dependent methyltransferase